MSGLFEARLAALSARRTMSAVVVLWSAAVIATALVTRPEVVPHFGFARQHVWAFFLLAVAPFLVLRAAQRVAPVRADDAAWLAVRSAGNPTLAFSTWFGVFAAWCVAVVAFAIASESGAPGNQTLFVAAGTIEAPASKWVATGAPLAWRATAPAADAERTASLELGMVAARGTFAEVRFSARGVAHGTETSSALRVENRGRVEVALPSGETAIDFALEAHGDGTRALVLSPSATLWTKAHLHWSAGLDVALRCLVAGAAWTALALALACFVGGATAACGVLALWIPVWMSNWPATVTRWIPGADLFDALAVIGTGRAPAAPQVHEWIGALVVVTIALAVTVFGLRRWRVSR